MNKCTQLSYSLVAAALLVGCGGGSSGGSNSAANVKNTTQVSIDAMTSVPVINGSVTQGTLYVHNYGNAAASDVSFSLGSATATTKVKAVLAKVGLNFGGYEDANGFVLINPERCGSIPAGGSCAVNFSTPSMSVGNLGNSLVKLSYSGGDGAATAVQVVNYKYVNLEALSGVNFTGGLNVTGVQGSTKHVVGYVYAGGASGSSYKNVNLNSTNATTRISNGFIDGQEVVAGQVIAVEFAVAMQSNKASAVNVTPSWGSSKLQASSLTTGSGSPLTLSLTPAQSTVNLIFGNIPVLSAPTTSAAVVNVANNGNADSDGGLTATATGAQASDLSIDYTNCSVNILKANAANACQITFSTSSYTSGTATVHFKNGDGTEVGSQTVVWTNTKPFPAVYLAPNQTTISFGKGQSTGNGSIVFTVNNVGQAPLNSVTYQITNTGSAIWTQDSSSCTAPSIGVLGSCAISGHLTGTNDGTGNLYIKAQGSFNDVNYSFVSLPIAYTITAIPSLQITPASASMTLLANNAESKSQTYTVTNIGNDPALFTSFVLNDSSSNFKPVINGGSCQSDTTLVESASCTVIVTYGPAAVNLTANESGIATLKVVYHGGTPDTSYNAQASLNYKLVGNDSYVTESTTVTNLSGAGTPGSPYTGNATSNPMKISLTYANPSVNYPMSGFNLNTNSLPYGLTVDPSSTCTTGGQTMSLESGVSCTLVLALDRSLLATAPQGGSVVLDFVTPTATWTTPLGFYSQPGTQTNVTYAQPVVVFSLSSNNANFESTVLSITGSNLDKGASTLPVSVSGVSNWLVNAPVSAGCTVNQSTYAVSCNLSSGSSTESVSYIMPNYLQNGDSANIPLIFSTSSEYAFLSPSYTFINYFSPVQPIVATINLPQTGQTPTLPITATSGMDGFTYKGVPWAYVTSGATTPATRFTVGTGAAANCVTDNLTGLMWIKDLNTINGGESMNWQPALDLIATANAGAGWCGYKDWYLPTINEVSSLTNDGQSSPAAWLNGQGFANVKSGVVYWSSTSSATTPTTGAWAINFNAGTLNINAKVNPHLVWPVRGGQ